MIGSYIKIALRVLIKNKLYAAINIVGLAIGLAMYLLSGLITDYERNHDHMFENRDRIYTVASIHNPARNHGELETRGTYMALKPLIKVQIPELEGVSRGLNFETLLKTGDKAFYQQMKFVDPDFTKMFNFDYIQGSADSITGPSQVVLTQTVATKYFGRTAVAGEMMTLSASSGDYPLQIVAVIKDVAIDSHFNSSITDSDETLGIFALTETVNLLSDELNPDENWGWLSSDYFTYLMTDGKMIVGELNDKINSVYRNNAPKDEFEAVSELKVRPLADANLSTWFTVGMPVIEIVESLGIFVLLIAIINYANLATAQNMGRAREVGMRKTLGADRKQLLIQFFIECQSIVFIAMLLALTLTEIFVPLFNSSLGKVLTFNYVNLLPWLIATTVFVGLIAGAYPAYMITKATPIQALANSAGKGRSGRWFRNIMIGTQFVISIIMMALVMVIFAQNRQVTKDSEIFPKSQIMNIGRISNDKIMERKDILHREISALDDVEIAAYSTQVPFMQQNWHWEVTNTKGDLENKLDMHNMMASYNFLKTYNVPLVAGRDFSRDILSDRRIEGKREMNVIINEMAAKSLGFTSPSDAIGKAFYLAQSNTYQLNIIGVMEDRNILGLQNQVKPFVIRTWGSAYRHLSVRLKTGASSKVISQIENIWSRINPEFPIDWSFLDAEFDETFKIMSAVNKIIAGFSILALSLALFGLFGLAAFMAEQRTREIGIRKVLGAGTSNIVKMLIVQFSHPVIIATVLALPLAYLASEEYLNFFAERIGFSVPLILIASLAAIALSWGIIAVHAIKVAKTNPINALRYE